MQLKTLPTEHRPREKLLRLGPQSLSDAELLALLLRTGVQGTNVVALAQRLLHPTEGFGSLNALLNASVCDMAKVKGLGPAKSAELLAVLELAKRSLREQLGTREAFQSPDQVKQFFQLHLASKPHEVFAVMFLDAQNRLIAWEELFRGTLNQASVYPREVLVRALFHQSSAVILGHNHPSGHVQPSRADESLTRSLVAALAVIEVKVLDHVIVAPGLSLSMAESGFM